MVLPQTVISRSPPQKKTGQGKTKTLIRGDGLGEQIHNRGV